MKSAKALAYRMSAVVNFSPTMYACSLKRASMKSMTSSESTQPAEPRGTVTRRNFDVNAGSTTPE